MFGASKLSILQRLSSFAAFSIASTAILPVRQLPPKEKASTATSKIIPRFNFYLECGLLRVLRDTSDTQWTSTRCAPTKNCCVCVYILACTDVWAVKLAELIESHGDIVKNGWRYLDLRNDTYRYHSVVPSLSNWREDNWKWWATKERHTMATNKQEIKSKYTQRNDNGRTA